MRQPGPKTLYKVKRACQDLNQWVVDHQHLFNGLQPETIALGIVLSARRLCKIEGNQKHIEALFGSPYAQLDTVLSTIEKKYKDSSAQQQEMLVYTEQKKPFPSQIVTPSQRTSRRSEYLVTGRS